MCDSDDLELAHRLATLADEIAISFFEKPLDMKRKADGTLVTNVDLMIESEIRKILHVQRPGDGILGEEQGGDRPDVLERRRWIIDPIDGTSWFVDKQCNWGTHIALEEDSRVSIAIITRPTHNLRWWAKRNEGAYRSTTENSMSRDTCIHVSEATSCDELRVGGYVNVNSPTYIFLSDRYKWEDGEVCAIGALAEGRLDVCVDEGGKPWDQAPASLIVQEAGGRFSDPHGGARIDQYWGLYTNGVVHEMLMEQLRNYHS